MGQNDLHALESRTTVLEVMERVSDGQTTRVDKERNAKAAGKVIEETEEEVKRENEVLEFEDVEVEIEEEVKRENEVLKEMAKVIKKKEEVKNEVIELEDTKAEIGDIGEEELIFEDVEITAHKDENSEKVAELGNTTKQKLPPVTDGIKVIVYQSEKLLGKDHFVMLRHQKAELFDNGKGKIYYMVGGFTTELDAFNFLDSFIASDKKYKDPFVAKFANGILTVLDQ